MLFHRDSWWPEPKHAPGYLSIKKKIADSTVSDKTDKNEQLPAKTVCLGFGKICCNSNDWITVEK